MAVDAVDDLFAQPGTNNGEVDLSWSAPDDGGGGACDSYDVKRYGTPIIEEADWTAATTIAQSLTPKSPGEAESLTVTGLTNGDGYWFAVRGTEGVDQGDIGRTAVGSAKRSTPAFPGAVGAGSYADGGRGSWTVIKVTNLNATGAGSLYDALRTNTPRIIIFEVAGTIALSSKTSVFYDDFYVAGETAFRNGGEGITVKNWPISLRCQNAIVRHLRIRPGDGRVGARSSSGEVQSNGHALELLDPFGGSGSVATRMIFHHCSFSWGDDETIQLWITDIPGTGRVKEITFQNCIIAEGLALTVAEDGFDNQGKGLLIGNDSDGEHCESMSLYRCLFIKNERRNPRLKGMMSFSIDNCIFYANGQALHCPNEYAAERPMKLNFRGNYQPTTTGDTSDYMVVIPDDLTIANWSRDHKVHCSDNVGNYYVDDTYQVVGEDYGSGEPASDNNPQWEDDNPFSTPGVICDPQSRADAYEWMIEQKNVGASLFVDAVDDRLIDYVIDGDEYAGWPNTTAEVGGYPALSDLSSVPTDTSGDGIPDDWKTAYGLTVGDDNSNTTILSDEGYTDLEVYLHDISGEDVVEPPPPTFFTGSKVAVLA